jgi:NAD(P)-dependent dehydrogenase (short-subunit alcohol dehydrogenase family)
LITIGPSSEVSSATVQKTSELFDLTGRTAIVTGAAQGIGHASLQARLAAGGAMSGPSTDAERLPLGMGNRPDIAAAVLYLVGPSGGYITGQSIVLDGGFLIS